MTSVIHQSYVFIVSPCYAPAARTAGRAWVGRSGQRWPSSASSCFPRTRSLARKASRQQGPIWNSITTQIGRCCRVRRPAIILPVMYSPVQGGYKVLPHRITNPPNHRADARYARRPMPKLCMTPPIHCSAKDEFQSFGDYDGDVDDADC